MSTATATPKPFKLPFSPRFTVWVGFLALVVLGGIISGVTVLLRGLVVTGLSNRFPWGLWIVLDLSSISLGAGAFILVGLRYLLGLERFEGVTRLAVLVGFICSSSAVLALLLDIGRPDRFWHPFIYWNPQSVLWQVTVCAALYFTILVLEFAPVILESRLFETRPKLIEIGHKLHRATPFLAGIGLVLAVIYQSSLGATYGIVTARPLWYNPSMPVLFILSASAGGMSAILLGALAVRHLNPAKGIKPELAQSMAVIAGGAMVGYLYLKIWTWASANYYSRIPGGQQELTLLLNITPYGAIFWLIEVLVGGVIPTIIFLWPRLRRNDYLLMLACVLAVVGAVMLRWNITISDLAVPLDWSPGVAFLFPGVRYMPTLPEVGAFVGVVAYMLLAFTLGVRFLPVFPQSSGE